MSQTPSMPRVSLRPVRGDDRSAISALLDQSRRLYPEFDLWLDRRFDQCLAGTARGTIAATDDGGFVVGVCLSIAKDASRYKISSLAVAPAFAGAGVDVVLLQDAVAEAARRGLIPYLTAATSADASLRHLISRFGFTLLSTERGRYGAGRDEYVFAKTGL